MRCEYLVYTPQQRNEAVGRTAVKEKCIYKDWKTQDKSLKNLLKTVMGYHFFLIGLGALSDNW